MKYVILVRQTLAAPLNIVGENGEFGHIVVTTPRIFDTTKYDDANAMEKQVMMLLKKGVWLKIKEDTSEE